LLTSGKDTHPIVVTSAPSTLQEAITLLVQPDRDDREMYAEFFHHQGLAAICVSNATLAMTIAPFADLIVTGIRLPGEINGIEFIGLLKRDDRTKNIPVVVLTACAWSTERERAEGAGCDVFLSKPCLPCELLRALERLLVGQK
jgi:two-component system cell cycle response regulator DivK